MASDRQQLREWSTLISHAGDERERFLEMVSDGLEDEAVGDVERLVASRGTPEVVRITRRDIEAETSAERMGRHLQVFWALYYRPSWIDRHMPAALVRGELTTEAERSDVRAFANVVFAVTRTAAADLAIELNQPPPRQLDASGVLGPID
jgi:hypothetical protein